MVMRGEALEGSRYGDEGRGMGGQLLYCKVLTPVLECNSSPVVYTIDWPLINN